MSQTKLGLVLSGGGAKGAYQVGVVRALAELGLRVDAISGASIGALNAALICGSPDMKQAALRLDEVWKTLAEQSPLKANWPAYFRLLFSVGESWSWHSVLRRAATAFNAIPLVGPLAGMTLGMFLQRAEQEFSLLSDDPLHRLMEKYLTFDALASGVPLYVSVYPSRNGLFDFLHGALANLSDGLIDTPPSKYLHLQSQPESAQKEALLASAAIPLIFQTREVLGERYSDGGLGGWKSAQGNTPVGALVDAGCTHIIVSHLSDGSFWDRADFPEATILELRPKRPIARDGWRPDILGFDAGRIASWVEQGYEDALASLAMVAATLQGRNEVQRSETEMQTALAELDARLGQLDNDAFAQHFSRKDLASS